MNKVASLIIVLVFSHCVSAQGKKAWSEWDKKDVERVLNSSAWGQTQSETAPAQIAIHVRLFTAKPIRQAVARNVMLSNAAVKPEQLAPFIDADLKDFIIIAVTIQSADPKVAAPVGQKFMSVTTETIKDVTYLERASDKKRIELKEYSPPTPDGTGAKFVFPKSLDGKEIFAPDDGFEFIVDLGNGLKISRKFKLSELKYEGKIEY